MQIDVIHAQKTAMIVVDMQNDFMASLIRTIKVPRARRRDGVLSGSKKAYRSSFIPSLHDGFVARS